MCNPTFTVNKMTRDSVARLALNFLLTTIYLNVQNEFRINKLRPVTAKSFIALLRGKMVPQLLIVAFFILEASFFLERHREVMWQLCTDEFFARKQSVIFSQLLQMNGYCQRNLFNLFIKLVFLPKILCRHNQILLNHLIFKAFHVLVCWSLTIQTFKYSNF